MKRDTRAKREFDLERSYIDQCEVIELWERIEQYQKAIREELAVFDDWLDGSPELAAVWNDFTQLGGLRSSELKRFFMGQTFRHRPIRQRRHLRLVCNKRR